MSRPLLPSLLFPSSFPRSCVGTHTYVASAAKIWLPTEDRGNPNNQRLGIASGHVLAGTPFVIFFLNAIDLVGNQGLHFVE